MAEYRKGGWKIGCLIFLGLIALGGINAYLVMKASSGVMEKAKEAVDMYHSALESGKCQDITNLKSVSLDPKDMERLVKVCEVLNREHGNLIKSHSMGSSTEVGTISNLPGRSGNFIILDYNSKFSGLSIDERFTWRFSTFGRLELASYETSE
jgi:hypothetical protein